MRPVTYVPPRLLLDDLRRQRRARRVRDVETFVLALVVGIALALSVLW